MNIINSKKIAKDSLYMYLRMGFILLISLYSSRIMLKILGVDDFGTYNLVGSIIATVSMLKSMFASSSQRFLNFEMPKNNLKRLRQIFGISIIINIFISIVFVFFVELLGFWFFKYKINISADRVDAAKYIFHLSVLSSVIVIMTTPYDAVLLAREKFNFYAVISVLDFLLRFIAILAVPYINGDNLIIYGILLLFEAIVIRIIDGIYCSRHFPECVFLYQWDFSIFKDMFKFASWQLLGNSAYTITQNGINMIFNVFGGPVVNAARGVSYQIYNAINQFMRNVNSVTAPFCIKKHAEGNDNKMYKMFMLSSKLIYLMNFITILPIIYFTNIILKFWLGSIPTYAIAFTQIILLWSLVRALHEPIDIIFRAFGKMKYFQITECIILSLPLVLSYVI